MRRILSALLAPLLAAQAPLEQRFREDLALLAGPELQGRGNGYPELDRAASFLAKSYERLGLHPILQRFPFVDRIARARAKAALGDGPALQWGKDIEAVGFSADATFGPTPLVFAGYGMRAGGYDDAEGLEIRGKVALIGRRVPELPAFAAAGRMERGVLARAQRLARAGAAAVVVLEDEEQPRPLTREEGPLKLEVPVLSLPLRVLSGPCGDLRSRLRRIDETGKPQGLDFTGAPGASLSLELALERHQAQLPNLAAVIPGTDPRLKAEYVVLAAHLDHLGRGERHSLAGEAGRGKVHPGADDNASGTAMVLELARELKRRGTRRSLLLLHVSGEEEGLLGSAHWVQNPTVPLPSVRFMVNFDMVGRLDPARPTLQLGGLGAPKAALARAKALAPEGLAVGEDLGMAVGGSDHMSFAAARIPTFFFFTGVHTDYHRPSDAPEKINLKGMATVAAMAERVVRELADGEQLPPFDPETAKLPAMRGGPVRVAFGAVPDFAEHPKGFRINGASPGSAAETAGLKAGDVITSFAGRSVRNIYDFQEALSASKPGERVVVKWLRGEAPMEAEATLKAR